MMPLAADMRQEPETTSSTQDPPHAMPWKKPAKNRGKARRSSLSSLYRIGGTNNYLKWWQPIARQPMLGMSDRQLQQYNTTTTNWT